MADLVPTGVSKGALMQKVKSQAKTIARVRIKAAVYGEKMLETVVTVGGGAAAGYMSVKWPGQWMSIDKEIWVGGGAIIVGLTGLGGARMSDAALSFGNGVMAVWAANLVKAKI